MVPITVSYAAKVERHADFKDMEFDEAWKVCNGKYPFSVMAIDGTRNRNDWGITAERLKSFGDKLAGRQLRMDHGDKALDVIGQVGSTIHTPDTDQVYSTAWTHEYEIAKRLHLGTLDSVSVQARATAVECGNCGTQIDRCKCNDKWKSLIDPEPVELSVVSEGAYPGARVISGFRAAIDQYFQEETSMSNELKAMADELSKLQAQIAAYQNTEGAPMPGTPAPTKPDHVPDTEPQHVPQRTGETVPLSETVNKLAQAEDEDEDKEKAALKAQIAELQAKCKAMEEDKTKAKAAFKSRYDGAQGASGSVPQTPPTQETPTMTSWDDYTASFRDKAQPAGSIGNPAAPSRFVASAYPDKIEAGRNANTTEAAYRADLLQMMEDFRNGNVSTRGGD